MTLPYGKRRFGSSICASKACSDAKLPQLGDSTGAESDRELFVTGQNG